jgi:hypothetical protein
MRHGRPCISAKRNRQLKRYGVRPELLFFSTELGAADPLIFSPLFQPVAIDIAIRWTNGTNYLLT